MNKLLIGFLALGSISAFANDSTCKNEIIFDDRLVEVNHYKSEHDYQKCMAFALVDLRNYQSRNNFSEDSFSAAAKVTLPFDERLKDKGREEKKGAFLKEPTVIVILSPHL